MYTYSEMRPELAEGWPELQSKAALVSAGSATACFIITHYLLLHLINNLSDLCFQIGSISQIEPI